MRRLVVRGGCGISRGFLSNFFQSSCVALLFVGSRTGWSLDACRKGICYLLLISFVISVAVMFWIYHCSDTILLMSGADDRGLSVD